MIFIIIYFLVGVCLLHLCSELPSVKIQVLIILIFTFIYFFFMQVSSISASQTKLSNQIIILLNRVFKAGFVISLGFSYASLHAFWHLSHPLPETIEGKPIQVVGTIVSLPENVADENARVDDSYRFEFQIDHTIPDTLWSYPGRCRLRWDDPPTPLHAGEVWQLTVKLKQPRSMLNPGGLDNERYFFVNHWKATGYVYEKGRSFKISDRKNWLSGRFERLREFIRDKIVEHLNNSPLKSLIAALIVSSREKITQEQWQVFQDTGTTHLMAISGLHVGLLGTIVFVAINFIWRRLPLKLLGVRILSIPASRVSSMIGLSSALLYACLSCFQRGVFMVAFLMLSIFLKRKTCYWRSYFLAIGFMLLVDPIVTLSPGFWMSFGAVGIIFYGMRGRMLFSPLRLGWKKFWWQWGRTQWIVCLGLTPLSLAIFGMTSFVAPIANIIAIPWISMTVVPLGLLGAVFSFSDSIASLCFKFAERSLSILWCCLKYFQSIPDSTWVNKECHWSVLIFAMLGVLWILSPRCFPGKPLALICFLPLILNKTEPVATGTALISILDVGQGLSVVVETKNHILLYDVGPKFTANFNTGDKVVEPYLKTRGKHKIDAIIISHGDNDHIGGLESIIQKMPVKNIITSEQILVNNMINNMTDLQSIQCYAGQRWEWDGVMFEMLHPDTIHTKKRNDHCCVLSVQAGQQRIILTGDIESKSEYKLIENYGKKLHATVLLVPHHGSKTSSTVEFIEAVHPTLAIIPAGYRNQYGHPREEIVARYQNLGVKLLDTIHGGMISFTLKDSEKMEFPKQYRVDNHHYWQGR